MGVSGKWIRALVGLKKQEKSHSAEKDENVGNLFFFYVISFLHMSLIAESVGFC